MPTDSWVHGQSVELKNIVSERGLDRQINALKGQPARKVVAIGRDCFARPRHHLIDEYRITLHHDCLHVWVVAAFVACGGLLGCHGSRSGPGEATRDSIKKAWETCVLRAYRHEPLWVKGGKLSEESRATLATINLHFHDLRHEAGSRWLEAGMPLHHVKEILGHANISQTDTYLNAGRVALQESMRRFDAARCTPVAQEPDIEHRPVSNDKPERPSKDLLH